MQKTHWYSRAQSGKYWCDIIIVTLWWYKTGQHNGYNHTHIKQKLLRRHRRACKSSWSRRGSQKSFTLTIPSNLSSLARNYPGSTPHRSETDGIGERAVHRIKEGTSAVLLQSVLDEKLWADSMECYSHLHHIQDLLSDGQTPVERRFGVPFHGPVVPFGAMVEYHPISAKDLSRLHQFRPKVLPGVFLGYALHAVKCGKET